MPFFIPINSVIILDCEVLIVYHHPLCKQHTQYYIYFFVCLLSQYLYDWVIPARVAHF